MNGDDLVSALLLDGRVYLHYTDGTGLDRMLSEGVIRTDHKGFVYFTQEPFSPEEAHNNLFIGASTHAGRGTHVIALRLDYGMPIEHCGLYEARVRQNVRIDQHGFLFAGENPFR